MATHIERTGTSDECWAVQWMIDGEETSASAPTESGETDFNGARLSDWSGGRARLRAITQKER